MSPELDQDPRKRPSGTPRGVRGRLVRLGGPVLVSGLVLGLLAVLVSGGLPSGTGTGSLAVRAAVALAIGLLLVLFVRRLLTSLAEPPPPSPEKVDARAADVSYWCTVCGTRVRLEVATTGKPPRHCGEEMEPSVSEP